MPKVFQRHPQPVSQNLNVETEQVTPVHEPVKTLLEWEAPSRPYKKRHASYYRTVAIIVVLVILVALFMREFILIGVILSFSFVIYVLGFVPPEDVRYKISTQGITIGDHFYFWGDLESFWFSQKDGFNLLNVLTHLRFPGLLIIMLDDQSPDEVRDILSKYLPYHEIAPQNFMDRWGDRIQRYFPLESPR